MSNYKLILLIISTLLSSVAFAKEGDSERGEVVFQQCAVCHMLGMGAENKIGPELNNIVGSKAANKEGFEYSDPFIEAAKGGLTWDDKKLDLFLENPKAFIPDNKMYFPGLGDEADRLDVIAYLNSINEDKPDDVVVGFEVPEEVLAIKGDQEYGEYLSGECSTCHKNSEESDEIPNIFILSKEAFITSMYAYKEKYRTNTVMQLIAAGLSDEEIASLAEHFNSLK